MQPGFSLAPRDPFADAKETLSSWDNCMAKSYCKWPVIVAIIVGGIIAFSVIFCIARCICCGAECVVCCCKCCTCCCGSSDSKKRDGYNQGYPPPQPYPQQPYASPNPYAEARSFAPPPPPPPPPQVDTQYQSHAPPAMKRRPTNPNFNPQVNPKFVRPESPERPQYATFDAHSKPVNEDALPEMPSWKNARNVHVEVEEDVVPEKRGDVEMDRLNHNGSVPGTSVAAMAGAGAVGAGMGMGMRNSPGPGQQGRGRGSPASASPVDGYGFPAGYQNQYDGRGSPAQQNQNLNISPYGQPGYQRGGPSPAQSYSQYSQGSDQYERRRQQQPFIAPLNVAPQDPYNSNAQQNTYGNEQHSPYDNAQQNPYSSAQQDPYNSSSRDPYTSPSPQNSYNTHPAQDRHASPAPPSYHTTAPLPRNPDPYAYAPTPVQPFDQPQPARSHTPGYGNGSPGGYAAGNMNTTGGGYEAVPNRSQTATPSAYPGQQTYQAFRP